MQKQLTTVPRKSRGYGLLELVIAVAVIALLIGGVLALTAKLGRDAAVRQTITDITDISNAITAAYAGQRTNIAAGQSTVMEGAAARQLPHLEGGTAGTLVTQNGDDINIIVPVAGATTAGWPHYVITYDGMVGACENMLRGLTSPLSVSVFLGDSGTTFTWTDPTIASSASTNVAATGDARADTNVATSCLNITDDDTYSVRALFRI